MMWVALVPSALLNQQYEVLKALLADFAAGEGAAERGGKQGMLGMAAGLGFLGMGLGTFIPSQESAAALALIFIAISGLVIYVLPTSPARASKATPGAAQSGASGGFFSMFMLPSARTPGAYVIFSLRVLMGFAFYIFMAIWNPSLKRRFEYFGPQEHAKLMGFIGLSYALAQGFLSKPLLKYGSMTSSIVPKSSGAKESSESSESSESDGAKRRIARVEDPTPVLIGCCVILGAGRIVSATTLSIYAIYASMGIIVISLGVFNSAISSAATMVAPPHEAGGFFGVLSSVESFCGILGPAVGGVIHKFGGDTGALAAVSSGMLALTLKAFDQPRREKVLAKMKSLFRKRVTEGEGPASYLSRLAGCNDFLLSAASLRLSAFISLLIVIFSWAAHRSRVYTAFKIRSLLASGMLHCSENSVSSKIALASSESLSL
eukprot:scaffold1375_cov255-Pinguiococcus_pyrenoidosus.AAC.8